MTRTNLVEAAGHGDTKAQYRLVDRIVVTTGRYAYRRPDGVAVVPLALMGM